MAISRIFSRSFHNSIRSGVARYSNKVDELKKLELEMKKSPIRSFKDVVIYLIYGGIPFCDFLRHVKKQHHKKLQNPEKASSYLK